MPFSAGAAGSRYRRGEACRSARQKAAQTSTPASFVPPGGSTMAHTQDHAPPRVIHYAPGDRPLCGNESSTAVYSDDPRQVAGCGELLAGDHGPGRSCWAAGSPAPLPTAARSGEHDTPRPAALPETPGEPPDGDCLHLPPRAENTDGQQPPGNRATAPRGRSPGPSRTSSAPLHAANASLSYGQHSLSQ